MPPISFNNIPSVTRVPFTYVEFDGSRSSSGPAQQEYKILLIGEKRTGAPEPELVPLRVTSAAQAKTRFGENSMLHKMCAAALKSNSSTPIYAIAVSPGTPAGWFTSEHSPDIEGVFTAIKDEQFNIIACQHTDADNLTTLSTELAQRFLPGKANEGFAFVATDKTCEETRDLAAGLNSPHISIMCTHGSPTEPAVWAATLASTVAFYGNIDPARPFRTLELVDVRPPIETSRLTFLEREMLLESGASTYTVDRGGKVRIESLVSSFKRNEADEPSEAYRSVNTLLTLSYLRFSFRNYFNSKYPRHKLAGDSAKFGAGQAVMTPSLAKAECIALFRSWEDIGLVQNIDQFKNDLIVEINGTNKSRLDFSLSPQLVNQLSVLGAKVQFLF